MNWPKACIHDAACIVRALLSVHLSGGGFLPDCKMQIVQLLYDAHASPGLQGKCMSACRLDESSASKPSVGALPDDLSLAEEALGNLRVFAEQAEGPPFHKQLVAIEDAISCALLTVPEIFCPARQPIPNGAIAAQTLKHTVQTRLSSIRHGQA